MSYSITAKSVSKIKNTLYLVNSIADLKKIGLSATKIKVLKDKVESTKANKGFLLEIEGLTYIITKPKTTEAARRLANDCVVLLQQNKITELDVHSTCDAGYTNAVIEGLALSTYVFDNYKSEKNKYKLKIEVTQGADKKTIDEIKAIVDATFLARDLVNEPHSYLNATNYSKEIKKAGKDAGFKVTVFNKSKIESLKMGGLLGVNKGSVQPPTFNILEWKPKKPVNKKPIVLVGKGVVYDTGGLSLKPTANSMDIMKCDMGGSAAVVGCLHAISNLKLNVHVIGLIPATDNRPGLDAIAPGDVLNMYDGTTVEVLNTDAEGRLVLADALSYAKKYKPELVIDLATLTGAAVAAIGPAGIVCMGNASEKTKNQLKESGNEVYERLAEFPMWDEYGEMIKSEVADIKNLGGPYAGAITAGKFLEHFTDYPWMHFDIAGPAYLRSGDSYRGKHGTGVGVRILTNFFQKLSSN